MKAIVNVPICPLTARPEANCPLADEVLLGMTVEVLERQDICGFWRVRTSYRYEGFVPVHMLTAGDDAAARWADQPKRIVFYRSFCDVLARPEVRSRPLITVPLGAILLAGETLKDGGWRRVWLPDGRAGWVRDRILEPFPEPLEQSEQPARVAASDWRQRVIETASRYRGAPYRWGGKTPLGIDCSGLVSMAYWMNGAVIWRDAVIQAGFALQKIPLEAIQPADLLYFPGHVALYLGEGRYLHATARTGSDGVVVNSLYPDAPDYREDLAGAIVGVGSLFGTSKK